MEREAAKLPLSWPAKRVERHGAKRQRVRSENQQTHTDSARADLSFVPMNPTRPIVPDALSAGTLSLVFPVAGGKVFLDTTGVPWIDGTTHPVDEVTHVFALLLLGIAGALLGGRSRWGIPFLFLALLGFGLVLGSQGAIAPMLDTIAMTTALALVLLILGKVHLAFAVVACVTGAFALFHGVADGLLMHARHYRVDYISGYAAANIGVIFAGVIVGEWIHRHLAQWSEPLHRVLERLHWGHV